MTSSEIRQSFLDFFKSKQHTIVPSSSLLPDSPNLLFTNAGMNQFVPIFLGQAKCPYQPPRAADTQKCIRAGGKHNDLDDVGLDTYHHTFFEMLGNWSFGDYFKREAIDWAWELITEVWRFPKHRLYATVYSPDRSKNDPSEFDQEAYDFWAAKFIAAGLDPKIHIVHGNKKDNFWMMGETGPCGPCSELHVDLTPAGDTQGALVNQGSAQCMEIWNLVFIQFNANADGTFSPLPARHVDTGMGFERVSSIIQCTKNFTDFTGTISNYETDIFRPIFDVLEQMSGKKYTSTLPKTGSIGDNEQEKIDVAFRVIADHIRTLSFAIADGIQPGNTDRNYVLRRILRRAVRYGRVLHFHQPFFYKLVDVLAQRMGEVFPELRDRKKFVQETIQREEETFNKTLDRGIELFNDEAAAISVSGNPYVQELVSGSARGSELSSGSAYVPGSAPASGAADRALAVGSGPKLKSEAHYSKRHLPHFERPWGKYMVSFSTAGKRQLTPADRDIVMASLLYAHNHRQYQLFAACVMPDHVHLLFEPQIKSQDREGKPIFWPLNEILHGIKSTTAHRINQAAQVSGIHVWQEESFDRLMRSESDLEEKFHYICKNPWENGTVAETENYPWLWTPDRAEIGKQTDVSREGAGNGARGGRAPQDNTSQATGGGRISGAFAFRLYDEQGFPFDLTELMARERGLTVDKEGFERLMKEQRTRARAAQKKEVISLSQIETTTPTTFIGFDQLQTSAKVVEVVAVKNKTAVILDTSTAYAEMGGQVGDTGEISGAGQLWRVANTQKTGNTFLHFLAEPDAPAPGTPIKLSVDAPRRHAIQRHHSVTHLLHWALHEVVGQEATQKGSFVGPDKLTFDFNSAALTPAQLSDVEMLVNERILENAGISWSEMPYADVKPRKDVMQFFGDKYGDLVRVVQIGGAPGRLDGYSMELCGGTHARATGELGLFRIVSESAVAAGVRRIEAVAGLAAYQTARQDLELIRSLAGRVNAPVAEVEKKLDALLAHQKELEKSLKSAIQRSAAQTAAWLLTRGQNIGEIPVITQAFPDSDATFLEAVVDALKTKFKGLIVVGGTANGAVALIANVSPEFTARVQAGKIIQAIAPIVGGKGGGKPDNARGGGKDVAKLDEALAKVKTLVG